MAQQLRWEKTNKDKRNLVRYARPGMTFYGITSQSTLGRRAMAPKHMCDRWTVTHMNGVLGGPMCGSMSLERVLHEHGPLYTSPITRHKGKALHPMWEPLPQVAGPLKTKPFGRKLDAAEIVDLEEQSLEARDRRRKSKPKVKWF